MEESFDGIFGNQQQKPEENEKKSIKTTTRPRKLIVQDMKREKKAEQKLTSSPNTVVQDVDVDSIEVSVDGVALADTEWVWEAGGCHVMLVDPPAPGSVITVSWSSQPECEAEE